jgi:hypothetical protein
MSQPFLVSIRIRRPLSKFDVQLPHRAARVVGNRVGRVSQGQNLPFTALDCLDMSDFSRKLVKVDDL